MFDSLFFYWLSPNDISCGRHSPNPCRNFLLHFILKYRLQSQLVNTFEHFLPSSKFFGTLWSRMWNNPFFLDHIRDVFKTIRFSQTTHVTYLKQSVFLIPHTSRLSNNMFWYVLTRGVCVLIWVDMYRFALKRYMFRRRRTEKQINSSEIVGLSQSKVCSR